MWKATLVVATLTVCLASAARADHDDRPGPDWIPMEQAIQKLHAAGYGTMLEIKADDGYWKAKAIKDGMDYKVRVDPRTGQVATSRPAPNHD